MSIEPYAIANSIPPALSAVRVEPSPLQRPLPFSAPQRAELHFGRVKPVLQYRSGISEPSSIDALSRKALFSTAKRDTIPNGPNPALEHPWSRILCNSFHNEFLRFTNGLGIFQEITARDSIFDHSAVPPGIIRPPFVPISSPKPPAAAAQSFLLIRHVKHLLHQQKIRDARRTLEIGLIHYPENLQIANLLRVISPDRVSSTDRASPGRDREITWIKRHGSNYCGKWVALDKDRLIAFTSNLNELLAGLDIRNEREKTPFIQHLPPE